MLVHYPGGGSDEGSQCDESKVAGVEVLYHEGIDTLSTLVTWGSFASNSYIYL